jgi:hypothetical protein
LGMFMRRLASLPSKGNSAPTQWSDLGWLDVEGKK